MKKLLGAAAVLAIATIFFSCKSTDGAAATESQAQEAALYDEGQAQEQADGQESEISEQNENLPKQENEILGQSDNRAGQEGKGHDDAQESIDGQSQSVFEERIPQSELDQDFLAEKEAMDLNSPEPGKSRIEQAADDSLKEKIRSSNPSGAVDLEEQKIEMEAAEEESSREAPYSSAEQKVSVRTAPSSSEKKQNALSDSSLNSNGTADSSKELSRVTSQGNRSSGGPLVGPGSDKAFGRDASDYDFSDNAAQRQQDAQDASTQNDSAISQTVNEGIALPLESKEEDEPKEEKPLALPSRQMRIKNNQFVDIVYPGSGWIYLGEEDSGDHFIFQGRKLSNQETTFTLRSKTPGSALLHFYKNDILTGNYIDDWILISVDEKSASDSIHATAPSYAEAVPPKFDRQKNKEQNQKALADAAAKKQAERDEKSKAQKTSESTAPDGQSHSQTDASENASKSDLQKAEEPAEKVQTVIQTSGQNKSQETESAQKTSIAAANDERAQGQTSQAQSDKKNSQSGGKAADLLERARKAYEEKHYEDALDLVQQFFDAATEDFDAGLYLEGLILEAKSNVRNIKSAIDAYDTLIKNWPQSPYWRRANERSIYLKRFYIDIR